MKILVSGSTGLIGKALVPYLKSKGHTVIPLVRGQPLGEDVSIAWNPESGLYFSPDFEGFDAVINLCGENIGSGRWTAEKKKRILETRVNCTHILSTCLSKLENPPKVLVNASAVGYYGEHGDTIVTEDEGPGKGYLANVCKEWEAAAKPAEDNGIRVVFARFGMVLTPEGGGLGKMLIPFKLGLGGVIGTGEQYVSWIAIDDLVRIVEFALSNETLSGPINVVSPEPVTNEVFTKTLGNVLNRPTFMSIPAPVAKFVFGEMADEIFLTSIRAEPRTLLHAEYNYKYPELEGALQGLLNKK
jgi:uncharacterized protein (TIGR01777 family)